MDNKVAGLVFLGVCIVLAVLLVTRTIGIVVSGAVFAVALVLLGSRLGRRGGRPKEAQVRRCPGMSAEPRLKLSARWRPCAPMPSGGHPTRLRRWRAAA